MFNLSDGPFLKCCLLAILIFEGVAVSQAVADAGKYRAVDMRPSSVSTDIGSVVEEFLASNLSASVGIKISLVESGDDVYSSESDRPFIPASLLKVVTSAAALDRLGPEYTIPTEYYWIASREKGRGSLGIRGYGDPSLVWEDLAGVVNELLGLGIKEIDSVLVDGSRFVEPMPARGKRAYEAGSSALSLNHNCVEVTVAYSPVKRGLVYWTTPGFYSLVVPSKFGSSNEPINVSIDSASSLSLDHGEEFRVVGGALSLSGGAVKRDPGSVEARYIPVQDPELYMGLVTRSLLRERGVSVVGGVRKGVIPQDSRLIITHRSKPLSDILRDLNYFSNNFIAEQLVNVIGTLGDGRFSRSAGLGRMRDYMKSLSFSNSSFQIVDASGLDYSNRITPSQLVAVLRQVRADGVIWPAFAASLSRSGVSGTLKDRVIPSPRFSKGGSVPGDGILRGVVRGKTGTLNGVSGVAGYMYSRDGVELAYAIIINGDVSKERSVDLEDDVLSVLSSQRLVSQ